MEENKVSGGQAAVSGDDASVIDVRGVVKAFGAKRVLDGVDLEIPRGSVVGLLGKNGAGKTTLLRCMMGLVIATSGEVRVFGEDAGELSDIAKEKIGYVPQTIQLHNWMSVGDMVEYVSSFYANWNKRLARELIGRFGLMSRDKCGKLSVGQMQKLGIVLAMGHEPRLLILDEPAASLDPAARRDFLKSILEIAIEGERTVVLSTHITSDLERVADRVAVMKEGRIEFSGELGTLKDRVKRLHVTARDALPESFAVNGMLGRKVEGNQAVIGVKEFNDADVARIRSDYGASVEVRDLDLEDIFLELHSESAKGRGEI